MSAQEASNTSSRAVIATLAQDRPGIVSELSALIHGLELNIEDSRMTVLGGEFAVLMSVSGREEALGALESQLAEQAKDDGFVYLFRRTSGRAAAGTQLFEVKVESMDHPGIVSGVTAFFSSRGVNIRELTTDTEPAPHTGTPVFSMRMEIEVGGGEAVDTLATDFQAFCEREGLDGDLTSL
ncbi:MAG: glycine cleavage system protein R [Pseudomonadales bacterium]